jgi:hypothetical protein
MLQHCKLLATTFRLALLVSELLDMIIKTKLGNDYNASRKLELIK